MLYEKIDFKLSEIMILKAETIIEYPFHKHENAYEIIMVLNGEIDLYLVNAHETMTAGDIQICNPNELHYIKGLSDDNVALSLYINAEASLSNIHDLRSFIFTTRNIDKRSESLHKLKASIRDVAEKFYEEKNKNSDIDEDITEMLNILIDDFQFYFIPNDYKFQANDVFKKNEIQISRIRRANNYIYDNYNKPIKLEDLAEIENITPQHLTNILKRGGGIGFRKLLNMARVEKSSHFLLESDKSLQTICYECGFSKYQYFNNTFKKFTGLTPAEFREKYKDLTIANAVPQFKALDKDQVIALLKEMRDYNKSIGISLKELNKDRLFDKDISATLDLKNYNHLTLFELVKAAAENLSLKNVILDGLFIAERKNAWDIFTKIIDDIIDIHLNVYISVDADIKLKEFDLLIKYINEYSENSNKAIKLISYYKDSRKENIDKFLKIAADNHIEILHSSVLDSDDIGDENRTKLYSLFSEKPYERGDDTTEFALFEKSGLKLPSYHICSMLKNMGKYLVQNTNDYYITTNETKSDIQFLFYNYTEEYITSADYDVNITGLEGLYAIREYRFRDNDSNNRFNPGFDIARLSADCLSILNESLAPSKSVKFVKSNNNYEFSFSLTPFEILLLSIEKI